MSMHPKIYEIYFYILARKKYIIFLAPKLPLTLVIRSITRNHPEWRVANAQKYMKYIFIFWLEKYIIFFGAKTWHSRDSCQYYQESRVCMSASVKIYEIYFYFPAQFLYRILYEISNSDDIEIISDVELHFPIYLVTP